PNLTPGEFYKRLENLTKLTDSEIAPLLPKVFELSLKYSRMIHEKETANPPTSRYNDWPTSIYSRYGGHTALFDRYLAQDRPAALKFLRSQYLLFIGLANRMEELDSLVRKPEESQLTLGAPKSQFSINPEFLKEVVTPEISAAFEKRYLEIRGKD